MKVYFRNNFYKRVIPKIQKGDSIYDSKVYPHDGTIFRN
jgi:hypothetical protein